MSLKGYAALNQKIQRWKMAPNKTNQPDPFFVRAAHEKGSGYL